MNYALQARMFKAFCDENRLQIIDLISDGETCSCVLLEKLEISQPTLSHHMKILCDSGMVISRRDSKWIYYTLNQERFDEAKAFLDALTTASGEPPKKCVNT
ncbi:metalloregulator ArsR/SmtB family transcription factor [Christensenellaceae bacterium OttesenSCG-928-K19]|nr:metalloregulator ArsR/SmtB family transcription factor [Christensenellaceae bacterium OttesenSCG-928-K19]